MVDAGAGIFQRENWVRQRSGPLYLQLSRHIERAIREGEMQSGDPLPAEREIADIGGISRVTVRKAVRLLEEAGFIVRRRGSGTTVASRIERVEQSLSLLTSFSQEMTRRGMQPRSVWLQRELCRPSAEEVMTLAISAATTVARISRLRIADDVPLTIERAVLSSEFLPEPERLGESLYGHLEKTGNRPVRAVQRICATSVTAEDADLLEVPEASPCLKVDQVSYLESGSVVEFTRSIHRGDAYDFIAETQIAAQSDEGAE